MNRGSEILKIRHGAALYTDILSAGMYDAFSAIWELIKNGWDAGVRKNADADYEIRVDVDLVSRHSLSGKLPALIVRDNGEGLTPPSLDLFLSIGAEKAGSASRGIMDQKRIGRIAAFTCLKNVDLGFWILSATSPEGAVRSLHVTPEGLSQGEITSQWVERDDTILRGMPKKGTFTAIILPNPKFDTKRMKALIEDVQWRIPRRVIANELNLFINGQKVDAPLLETELIIEHNKIVGYFDKDVRKKPKGIRICDAETGVVVAQAKDMSDYLPYPMGRAEITGDLFVPGLIKHQRTDRSGLAPNFLRGRTWRGVQLVLHDHFCNALKVLLGDEAFLRSNPISRTLKDVAKQMGTVWGQPDHGIEPPPGLNPIDRSPSGKGGNKKNDDDGKDKKDKKPRPPRLQRFSYGDRTFFLGISRLGDNQTAEMHGGNVVMINSKDPLHDKLKSAPAALRLHLMASIIGAIERKNEDNSNDPEACEQAIQRSLVEFFEKRE